mgnify:CR=1 FL=1
MKYVRRLLTEAYGPISALKDRHIACGGEVGAYLCPDCGCVRHQCLDCCDARWNETRANDCSDAHCECHYEPKELMP